MKLTTITGGGKRHTEVVHGGHADVGVLFWTGGPVLQFAETRGIDYDTHGVVYRIMLRSLDSAFGTCGSMVASKAYYYVENPHRVLCLR